MFPAARGISHMCPAGCSCGRRLSPVRGLLQPARSHPGVDCSNLFPGLSLPGFLPERSISNGCPARPGCFHCRPHQGTSDGPSHMRFSSQYVQSHSRYPSVPHSHCGPGIRWRKQRQLLPAFQPAEACSVPVTPGFSQKDHCPSGVLTLPRIFHSRNRQPLSLVLPLNDPAGNPLCTKTVIGGKPAE